MSSAGSAFAGATEEPYITAIDSPYPGYVVTIPRPGIESASLRRRFFGSKLEQQEYLQLARRWRDRMYQLLHGRPVPVRAFHRRQANSSTGVAGVRRVVRKVRSRHDPRVVYEVAVFLAEVWLQPGADGQPPSGSRSRQFSDSKPTANADDIKTATNYVNQAIGEILVGKPVSQPTTRAYGCSIKYSDAG
jgi:hypothetical protein